jgi:hypothetical protein
MAADDFLPAQVARTVVLVVLLAGSPIAFLVFWSRWEDAASGTLPAIAYGFGMVASVCVFLSLLSRSIPESAGSLLKYGLPAALGVAAIALVVIGENWDKNAVSDSEYARFFRMSYVGECVGYPVTEKIRAVCQCAAERITSAYSRKELEKIRGYGDPKTIALAAKCKPGK